MQFPVVSRMLAALCLGGSAALVLATGAGAVDMVTKRVDLDKFTCGELLALSGEARDRVLIYFNGYLDGTQKATAWDAAVVGKRIDHVIRACQASPKARALDEFRKVWSR